MSPVPTTFKKTGDTGSLAIPGIAGYGTMDRNVLVFTDQEIE